MQIYGIKQWVLYIHEDFANPTNWATGTGVTTKTYKCGYNTIFGKYSTETKSVTKTFSLPAHSYLKIQFTVYFLDSWDDDEYFYAYVDDQKIYQDFYHNTGTKTTDERAFCSDDWIDIAR